MDEYGSKGMTNMPEEGGTQAKSVTIESVGDGTYMVGTASHSMPDGEMMEGDMGEGMQPAATIDEVCEMVRALLEGGDGMSADEQVMMGYNKGAKPAAKTGMPMGKVFGEE